MVLVVVQIDQEVVYVNNEPSFGDHVSEGVRHELLKGWRGVGHAEEHDGWFIKSSMSNEGCLPLISFFYLDVVISPAYVEFGEDLGVF